MAAPKPTFVCSRCGLCLVTIASCEGIAHLYVFTNAAACDTQLCFKFAHGDDALGEHSSGVWPCTYGLHWKPECTDTRLGVVRSWSMLRAGL